MRVLLIATTPFVIEKGSSLRVLFMAETLARAGHKVDVLTYPVGRTPKIKGMRVFRIKSNYKRTKAGPSLAKTLLNFKILSFAKKLIKKRNYDVIQGEDTEAGFIACLLKAYCNSRKPSSQFHQCRIVYDMHNRMSEQMVLHKAYPLVPPALLVEKYLFSSPDLIITNWKRVQDQLGKHRNKSILVYDSVKATAKRPNIRLPQHYLVYTGNFEHYQGTELLIRAFKTARIKQSLVLVGPHKKQTLVHKGRKIVFTGRMSVEETNHIIQNAKYCVIPRVHGKQPSMKLIHYLLNYKPVLATDIECNHEVLDKTNTLFVKPSIEALAKGMERMPAKIPSLIKGIRKVLPHIQQSTQEMILLMAYDKLNEC